MMMLFLYIWSRVDVIWAFALAVLILCVLAIVIQCIALAFDSDLKPFVYFRRVWIVAIISAMIVLLVPSKRDFAVMYVVPKIVSSEITDRLAWDIPEMYTLGMKAFKAEFQSKAGLDASGTVDIGQPKWKK